MYTGLSIITSVSDRSDDNVGHKIRYPFLLLDERQQSTEFISMMKIVKSRDAYTEGKRAKWRQKVEWICVTGEREMHVQYDDGMNTRDLDSNSPYTSIHAITTGPSIRQQQANF